MGSGISNNLKGQNGQQEIQQQNLYNNQQDNNLQSSRKNSITGNNLDIDAELQHKNNENIQEILAHTLYYDEAPLLQTMEIYVSCENLQNMDIISDSDPQVKLQKEKNGEWEDIGVTEIIPDNLDPKFATPFILTYDIDRPPKLRLEVYDVDKCQSVKKAIEIDEMGEAECNLQDLLEAKDNFLQLRLTTITKSQKKKEKIKQNSKSETQIKKKNPTSNRFIKLKGYLQDKFDKQFLFKLQLEGFKTKLEQYIKISKIVDKEIFPLYMTECVKNSQKGILQFASFFIQDEKLKNSSQLLFQIVEFNKKNTKQKIMGEHEINLEDLIKHFKVQNQLQIPINKSKTLLGSIIINDFKRYMYNYEFLKYIYGGCNLRIILALDFSDPHGLTTDYLDNPDIYDYEENEEIQMRKQAWEEENCSLINVAEKTMKVLKHLDSNCRFVTYGFGAKIPPYKNYLSNCFALNADYFDPEIDTIAKIKEKYYSTINSMKFTQRPVYSDVIKQARKFAKRARFDNEEQNYVLLVMITKGNLYPVDIEKTKDEIVKSSYLPISILNIGINNGNYDYAGILEPDLIANQDQGQYLLYSEGLDKEADCNNFHFVNHEKHVQDFNANSFTYNVLKKFPQNFVRYARKRNLAPLNNNLNIKQASQLFFERKKLSLTIPNQIQWLWEEEEKLYSYLVNVLHHSPKLIRKIFEFGLPCIDINYILERISYERNYQENNRFNNESYIVKQINLREKNKIKQNVIRGEVGRQNYNRLKISQYQQKQQLNDFLSSKKENNNKNKMDTSNIQENNKGNSNKNTQKREKQLTEEIDPYTEQIIYNVLNFQKQIMQNEYGVYTQPIDQSFYCVTCQINSIDMALMPCGHAYCCRNCYKLQEKNICSSCNLKVEKIVRLVDVTDQDQREIQSQKYKDSIFYVRSSIQTNNKFQYNNNKQAYDSKDSTPSHKSNGYYFAGLKKGGQMLNQDDITEDQNSEESSSEEFDGLNNVSVNQNGANYFENQDKKKFNFNSNEIEIELKVPQQEWKQFMQQ